MEEITGYSRKGMKGYELYFEQTTCTYWESGDGTLLFLFCVFYLLVGFFLFLSANTYTNTRCKRAVTLVEQELVRKDIEGRTVGYAIRMLFIRQSMIRPPSLLQHLLRMYKMAAFLNSYAWRRFYQGLQEFCHSMVVVNNMLS